MAVSPLLATVPELATLLRITLVDSDAYALMILAQASQAVRDAGEAGWVRLEDPEADVPGPGQLEAPQTAHDIALQLAGRAYKNTGNLARRSAGPITETYFENGLAGLELSLDERERLGKLKTGGGGGLWVQPTGDSSTQRPIILPDSWAGADPVLYADPQWSWAFEPRT